MTSNIDTSVPFTGEPLQSAPIRNNFVVAATEITALQNDFPVNLATNVTGTLPIANGGTGATTANGALNAILPLQTGHAGDALVTDGTNAAWTSGIVGTVTSVSVTTANGVSGVVATPSTTPAISLTLGDVTPNSVIATAGIQGTQLTSTIVTGTPPLVVASTTQVSNLNVARSGVADTVTLASDSADSTSFVAFSGTATGNQALKTNAGFTYDATANAVAATTFSGALNGNAATATTSTNIQTQTESSDTTCFPVFVTASGTQALPAKTNTTLTYNASTGILGATGFNGPITGSATQINVTNEAADTTCFPIFVDAVTGDNIPHSNAGLTYNASTNSLGATSFSGALTGNASTATALQNARTIGGVSFDGTGNIVPQTIQSVNEASDTTCFPLFISASGSQSLQPLNSTALIFNASTGTLGATTFSGAGTGLTGTAASLTAGNVTTNANLSGPISSSGNTTSITSQTGTGTKFVVDNGPTLVIPVLGVATATSIAIGGATIGSNGLAVTGGIQFNNDLIGTSGGGFRIPTVVDINQSQNVGVIINSGKYFGWSNSTSTFTTQDTILSRRGAANIQHGAADAASPVNQIVSTQGSRAATDSNIAGANLTIQSGIGTGNSTGSSLVLQAPVAVASGTGAQTPTTFLTGTGTSVSIPVTLNNGTLTISSAVATDGSKNLVSVANTGTGNNVLATSPALTTPNIGAATASTILVGSTSVTFDGVLPNAEIAATNGLASLGIVRASADTGPPSIFFVKNRNASLGSNTIVQSGDSLGDLDFYGSNGTDYNLAARIIVKVDGTPGSSADMPGRIEFYTSSDGSGTPTQRGRLDNAGNWLLGYNGTTGVISTSATDGMVAIPTCAGAKTGTPTAYTGMAQMVYDTTNNKLWIWNPAATAWKSAVFI